MEIINKYIGKVIDNNDTDQEGKIQIKVEELHHDLNTDQLPWARQDKEWTSYIPEIDDLVWVYFLEERYHKKCYYGNKLTLKEYHDHTGFADDISSVVGSETEYPDIKYIKLKNNITIALSSNSDTPEIIIYHPSAYLFIDKDGNIHFEGQGGNNKIDMDDSGIIIEDKNGNSITLKSSGTIIEDKNSNTITMGSSSVKINDTNLEILQ